MGYAQRRDGSGKTIEADSVDGLVKRLETATAS
jgi:hypothetical protein